MDEPVVTKEQFSQGEELPDCSACGERLANISNNNNLCLHCEDVTGSNCQADNCKAGHLPKHKYCKDHTVERLYELYEQIFELISELKEERETISDLSCSVTENQGAKALKTNNRIRAIKNSYSHKNEKLMELAQEAQHLQNLVDIHAIDFS